MTEDHDHSAGGAHEEPRNVRSPYADRVRAVQMLLQEKGVLTAEEVTHQLNATESRNPDTGARIVARSWVDAEFRELLFRDFAAAAAQMGITSLLPSAPVAGEVAGHSSGKVRFEALENGPRVHHMVVCTLCSCYPRAVIGNPPDWYKSAAYRSRANLGRFISTPATTGLIRQSWANRPVISPRSSERRRLCGSRHRGSKIAASLGTGLAVEVGVRAPSVANAEPEEAAVSRTSTAAHHAV